MKKLLKPLIFALIGIAFLFQFIITFHRVADQTMEATINKGELVWINKAAAGAWFLGMKLPGLGSIEPNDIIYHAGPHNFDAPLYEKERLISRVVGLPGQAVRIMKKEVTVNKEPLAAPDSAQFQHRIILRQTTDAEAYFKKNAIDQLKTIIDTMSVYEAPITREKAKALKKDKAVDYVNIVNVIRGGANRIFPKSPYRSWSEDNFGPLRVPKKGDKINLTYRNYDIYKNIIIEFEGNQVRKHKDEIFINGKLSNSYTIKKNYYFVLDDNRDEFFDSREWGFVPEEYILGKVIGQ
ncbi:MAG: signal peptidase I [Salinivirgaceae bacterium]